MNNTTFGNFVPWYKSSSTVNYRTFSTQYSMPYSLVRVWASDLQLIRPEGTKEEISAELDQLMEALS